jgi:hypothetical protein
MHRRIPFPTLAETFGFSSEKLKNKLGESGSNGAPQPLLHGNHNLSHRQSDENLADGNNIHESALPLNTFIPRSEDEKSFPPVIVDVDLIEETFVVYNPNVPHESGIMHNAFHLHNWTVSDQRKLHVHRFGPDCWLLPQMKLHVYTCPGKSTGIPRGGFKEPYILWTNRDGSLRKKEILNNDADSVYLFDNFGECRAFCSATRTLHVQEETNHNSAHPHAHEHEYVTTLLSHVIHQGIVEVFAHEVKTSLHPTDGNNSHANPPKRGLYASLGQLIQYLRLNFALFLSFLRLGFILAQFFSLTTSMRLVIELYWAANLLDLLGR